jgi:hypothetical protein
MKSSVPIGARSCSIAGMLYMWIQHGAMLNNFTMEIFRIAEHPLGALMLVWIAFVGIYCALIGIFIRERD